MRRSSPRSACSPTASRSVGVTASPSAIASVPLASATPLPSFPRPTNAALALSFVRLRNCLVRITTSLMRVATSLLGFRSSTLGAAGSARGFCSCHALCFTSSSGWLAGLCALVANSGTTGGVNGVGSQRASRCS